FGWGMRQIAGHMQEFWALRGLDIAVPSFGLLSERFRTLEVQVKQRCQRVASPAQRRGDQPDRRQQRDEVWPGQRMASAKVRPRCEPDAVAQDASVD
ncbi:hypothetical protein, partial [Burkholderia ubonensis]|uniref:hypothetical protein n=1 Tax=Burkholderia ubonensis TaxID=101571 RepID=UPI0018E01BDC